MESVSPHSTYSLPTYVNYPTLEMYADLIYYLEPNRIIDSLPFSEHVSIFCMCKCLSNGSLRHKKEIGMGSNICVRRMIVLGCDIYKKLEYKFGRIVIRVGMVRNVSGCSYFKTICLGYSMRSKMEPPSTS